MKNLILGCLASMTLMACASGPSAYGPVSPSSSLGFESQQLEQDRFRISYTGRSPIEAQDYALLRAAEIALDEGYSHFRVLHGALSDANGGGLPVASSIGIGYGGGHYGRGGRTHVGVGIGVNDVARALQGERVRNTIEVKFLNAGSTDPSVYDAASVAQSIRPPVFQNP